MPEQQCFYEAQRKSRDLRRALYEQELCRPLGFPCVQRKTSCSSAQSKAPTCGLSYRATPPNFLHHFDFNPVCRPDGPPPYPEPPNKCLQAPVCIKSPPSCKDLCVAQCSYLPFFPPMPPSLAPAIRCFPPDTAAETIVSGFRNAHNGPNFQTTSVGDFKTTRSPCSYMSNFQIVHTMVNLCPPKVTCYSPKWSCYPSKVTCCPSKVTCCPSKVTCYPSKVTCCPSKVTCYPSKVSCCPSKGYQPDEVGIRELDDEVGQQLGLHGYRKLYECPKSPPPLTCCTTHHLAPPTRHITYTTLPGIGEDTIIPKPWRDPCGGRIYFRLTDNDLLQQWGSPAF